MTSQPESSKYHEIMGTAKTLFWKHGIRRVSVEEICKEAGVSKMTFYRFFPNKTELAKTVLRKVFEDSMVEYRELMASDIPFEEKVRSTLKMKFEGTRDISAELVKDIYSHPDPELGHYLEDRTREAWKEIFNDYSQAQQKGWIRKDLRITFLFYVLNKMQEMAVDEQLQAQYENTSDMIMEIANFFFYGILPREPQKNE